MWLFRSDLSKEGVHVLPHVTTMLDNPSEPTGVQKLGTTDVAQLDMPTSTGKRTSVVEPCV